MVPRTWSPFNARFTVPNIGWTGVFGVSIVFDIIAAGLAFFVLKRLKAPQLAAEAATSAAATGKVTVPGAA